MPECCVVFKQLMIWRQPSAKLNYSLLFNRLVLLRAFRNINVHDRFLRLINQEKLIMPSCRNVCKCFPQQVLNSLRMEENNNGVYF